MAFTYTINPSGGDSHQSSPYWFAAFVRFAQRDTFTRDNLGRSGNVSKSETGNLAPLVASNPVEEMPEILIADDVTSWSTTSAKDQHVSNCQLNFANDSTNYVREVAPGDWMGFWVFDNRDDYARVREAVLKRDRANAFNDGLKFIGRCDAPRKLVERSAQGALTVSYSITSIGFSEFDSIIYYNPILAAKYENAVSLWMMEFGQGVNDLLVSDGKGLIGSNTVIPKLVRLCLGVGGSDASKGIRPDQDPGEFINPEPLQSSPNRAYLVPKTVAGWLLGTDIVETKKAAGLTYADLLKMYIGIQKYGSSVQTNFTADSYQGFLPDSLETLSGDYRMTVTPFDGKPVWSILKTYTNEPIDELYTCMRVDKDGNVMPSLVARQNPMTTKWFNNHMASEIPTTAFTELPRWEIHSDMIIHLDVGRSNVMRTNYLHYQGQDLTIGDVNGNRAVNYTRNPPIFDSDDITRSGLRMHSKQLSANVNEGTNQNSPGGKWQKIMADILMGSHLKYSGNLICKGIVQPIPEGDNLVVDDTIYHIERVVHSGTQIGTSGMKDFNTTLMLSNGVSIDNDTSDEEIVYPDMSPEGTLIKVPTTGETE